MSTQTNEDSPKGQATDNNPMNAAERQTMGKKLRKQAPRAATATGLLRRTDLTPSNCSRLGMVVGCNIWCPSSTAA